MRVQIYVKNLIEVGTFYPSLIDSQPATFYPSLIDSQPAAATIGNNEASLVDSQPLSLVDP
jgi:hypothetical protein